MDNPTQEQLDSLARFAGLELRESKHLELVEFYYKIDGNPVCVVDQWNPYTVPAHTMLVLEALAEKGFVVRVHMESWQTTINIMRYDGQYPQVYNPVSVRKPKLPEAVCSAVLAVITKRK